MSVQEMIGLLLVGAGVFFSLVGIIGMVRLPDVYSRIHASGKVATLGLVGLLAGGAVLMPSITFKVIVLALFLVISTPVASHAIASAACRQGVVRVNTVRDDLAIKPTASDTN
jgi:multicomponent Na+:H+ antiporter subunit G